MGFNDLIYNFTPVDAHQWATRFVSTKDFPDIQKIIIPQAVNNIIKAKNSLIAQGVPPQNIYIFNLPDITLTPFFLAATTFLPYVRYMMKTDVIQFNSALTQALQNETTNRLPTNHIIDVYSLLNDMVENKNKYSLTNVDKSCIDKKGGYPYCNGYLFAQGKHPSTAVHQFIAELVENTLVTNANRTV